MKLTHTILLVFALIIASCKGQTEKNIAVITPQAFSGKITETPNAQILDVRTPEEFSSEHIDNAVNVDWRGNDFESKVSSYDKEKPVFVYCLSGGRSKKAAEKLSELGFSNVYELEGGIMKWNAEGMGKPTIEKVGMSSEDFQKLLNTDKKVLVDFYAEWCGPCKKMTPYLLKMQAEMAKDVTIIRIDVDKNKTLAIDLKIDQLPTLVIYQNKEVKWRNIGYISEEDLKKQL